jgi:hypothetical protein
LPIEQVMARKRHTSILGLVTLLSLAGYSCSLPFFEKNRDFSLSGTSPGKGKLANTARLSGVISLGEGCKSGYFQIKLYGLFEGGSNQVEAQSDQNGRFNIVAPPGHYLIQVQKDGCGTKETIELEENTEHMIALSVSEIRSMVRLGDPEARLPASVLIPVSKP